MTSEMLTDDGVTARYPRKMGSVIPAQTRSVIPAQNQTRHTRAKSDPLHPRKPDPSYPRSPRVSRRAERQAPSLPPAPLKRRPSAKLVSVSPPPAQAASERHRMSGAWCCVGGPRRNGGSACGTPRWALRDTRGKRGYDGSVNSPRSAAAYECGLELRGVDGLSEG